MRKTKHNTVEIISKFGETEVVIGSGNTVAEAARRIAVTEQVPYRGLGRDPRSASPLHLNHRMAATPKNREEGMVG